VTGDYNAGNLALGAAQGLGAMAAGGAAGAWASRLAVGGFNAALMGMGAQNYIRTFSTLW